ncbi:MAG: branched-chain amino acid ABC transporter permease [Actinomycetales bacterium]|nr:branched-chain amino acid ABC transporter permease [Actinomycetales bacterium]
MTSTPQMAKTISASTRHRDAVRRELRLFQTPWTRYGALALVLLAIAFPFISNDPFLLSLGVVIGVFSIGAIGLNVVNGYAGQITLAQPFFMAVGGFTAVGLGAQANLPLPVWLVGAAITSGVAGLIVGPFALRLKGVYQIVLSMGLIFIGHYIFVNWKSLTGGNSGISASVNMSFGPIDFGKMQFGGMVYTYQQGLFIVIWVIVAICMLLVHQLMKSAGGRAMVALRDAELPAKVAGVQGFRTLVAAFVVSGSMGGVAGALYVAQIRYASVEQFNLIMALQFIIIVTIGGLGTAWGPVLGSFVICSIPLLAGKYAGAIPFLKADSATPDGTWGIAAGQFSILVYGLVLILVLLYDPKGLVHIFTRWGRGGFHFVARFRKGNKTT